MLTKKQLIVVAVGFFTLSLFLVVVGIGVFTIWKKYFPNESKQIERSMQKIEKFKNEEEFRAYFATNSPDNDQYYGMNAVTSNRVPVGADIDLEQSGKNESIPQATPDRYSETNVQVLSIDEADYVKTDGKTLYISSQNYYYPVKCFDCDYDYGYNENQIAKTTLMDIQTPAQIKMLAEIENNGELYLSNDVLLILSDQKIVGYDISDKTNPTEIWKYETNDSTRIVSTRKFEEKIYLVTNTSVNLNNSCSNVILEGKSDIFVACTNIFYPSIGVPVDSTYTILIIDPQTGEVEKQNSFVGLSSISTVYMSTNNIYVTFYYPGEIDDILIEFMISQTEIFPDSVINKIKKLKEYDISQSSKLNEITVILEEYYVQLSEDDQAKLENNLENKISDYMKEKKRELEYTGIMKINTKELKVEDVGIVPGTLLNQFSLDEYENNLRVATTIEGNWWLGLSSEESVNDVYVLDNDMKRVGQVLDLGKSERIYSVRFVGDMGYVVTYRQIDPFYVLDLSDPSSPKMAGELKIPGYSAYLHPLEENYILGIGKEDWKVKLSIFDVSDPTNPKEVSKYVLDDYYTEIESNHHDFLLDKDHEYFFIPGSNGGYIFSYDDMNLVLDKVFTGYEIDRAVYVNETLFVINTTTAEVKAYEIGTWNEIKN